MFTSSCLLQRYDLLTHNAVKNNIAIAKSPSGLLRACNVAKGYSAMPMGVFRLFYTYNDQNNLQQAQTLRAPNIPKMLF